MAVTGPIPDLVAPMLLAVDLAEKHVNEQGGLFADGQKYTVVRADSGCDPTAAVDAVTKLVNVEQVSAIIGPVCSWSNNSSSTIRISASRSCNIVSFSLFSSYL